MNNEYLIQKETLTGLADEIRTLSGTENLLGIVTMTEKVNEANMEISGQTDLITQITEAIVGKGIPSETCTIEFTGNLKYIWIAYQDLDGAHYLKTFSDNITIKKNSIITFAAYYQSNYSDEIEFITQDFFSDEEIWVQCYYCTNNGQIEINSHLS